MRLMICEKTQIPVSSLNIRVQSMKKTRYNVEFEMKMYFMITELLNNINKHSGAKNTTLSLQQVNDQLLIHVWDNGTGFDTNTITILLKVLG
jgi:signal transduction histidine kinase